MANETLNTYVWWMLVTYSTKQSAVGCNLRRKWVHFDQVYKKCYLLPVPVLDIHHAETKDETE